MRVLLAFSLYYWVLGISNWDAATLWKHTVELWIGPLFIISDKTCAACNPKAKHRDPFRGTPTRRYEIMGETPLPPMLI